MTPNTDRKATEKVERYFVQRRGSSANVIDGIDAVVPNLHEQAESLLVLAHENRIQRCWQYFPAGGHQDRIKSRRYLPWDEMTASLSIGGAHNVAVGDAFDRVLLSELISWLSSFRACEMQIDEADMV